jgi:hypothetical protein
MALNLIEELRFRWILDGRLNPLAQGGERDQNGDEKTPEI